MYGIRYKSFMIKKTGGVIMEKKIILLIFSMFCPFILFGCTNTEVSEDSLKIEEEVQKQDVMDEEKENHIEKETPKWGEAWEGMWKSSKELSQILTLLLMEI